MKRGGPFNEKQFEAICRRVSNGETLAAVCRDRGMPVRSTVQWWVVSDTPAGTAARYARAREAQAEAWADQIIELADLCREGVKITKKGDGKVEQVTGDMVERARLQVDSRKWLMARLHPRAYGERVQQQQLDKNGNPADQSPQMVIYQWAEPKPEDPK